MNEPRPCSLVMSSGSFERGVFVNCPYSPNYWEKLKSKDKVIEWLAAQSA